MTEERNLSIATNMIHSEEEIRHALSHLLGRRGFGENGAEDGLDYLQGHETMTLYRNVRKKYVSTDFWADHSYNEGPSQVCTFRSIDQGLLAAYQAGCCPIEERPASAMYVNVNTRDVVGALKETYQTYFKWLEHQAGTTKEQVRRGNRSNFAGTLDIAFRTMVSHHKSRGRFSVIDVDDDNPDTWLKSICEAVEDDGIEMVIETKNGFHVVYQPSKMSNKAHLRLKEVLKSDTEKGKDANVSKLDGSALSCILPGGYQADHKARIIRCSCHRS